MAVVFDIGSVARDGEQVHAAAKRQIQKRLGYCPMSNLVADWEAKLEADGHWEAFLAAANTALGRPWDVAKGEQLAADHFSHVLSVLDPDRYPEPTSLVRQSRRRQVRRGDLRRRGDPRHRGDARPTGPGKDSLPRRRRGQPVRSPRR